MRCATGFAQVNSEYRHDKRAARNGSSPRNGGEVGTAIAAVRIVDPLPWRRVFAGGRLYHSIFNGYAGPILNSPGMGWYEAGIQFRVRLCPHSKRADCIQGLNLIRLAHAK